TGEEERLTPQGRMLLRLASAGSKRLGLVSLVIRLGLRRRVVLVSVSVGVLRTHVPDSIRRDVGSAVSGPGTPQSSSPISPLSGRPPNRSRGRPTAQTWPTTRSSSASPPPVSSLVPPESAGLARLSPMTHSLPSGSLTWNLRLLVTAGFFTYGSSIGSSLIWSLPWRS